MPNFILMMSMETFFEFDYECTCTIFLVQRKLADVKSNREPFFIKDGWKNFYFILAGLWNLITTMRPAFDKLS